MNKKLAVPTFFLFILCFAAVGNASAQTSLVGVSPGNTFKYNLTFYWNSTNPADVVPAYLVEQNQTDYLQLTVETTTGTTVVTQAVWQLLNGTASNSTDVAEVSSGATGSIYVYAANLTAGGLLFPLSEEMPYRINDTSFRSYPSGFRETNHIAVNNTNIEGEVYSYMDLYFDKQTGIVVEYTLTGVSSSTPNQTVVQHFVLKDSNAWVVPEFPTLLILPLLMAASAITLVLFKRRRR
jgi:hypothetical protein